MIVKKADDPEFKQYGQVIHGMDTRELISAMEKIPMPDQGTNYLPAIDELEKCQIYDDLQMRFFGGMPMQLGMCWGHNNRLNCLEFHRDSEINIGNRDFWLLVAGRQDINDGKLNTENVKAFLVKAGQVVELYATTLHYAPCHTDEQTGFRVAVGLPKGTNTSFSITGNHSDQFAEDAWLWARNKWLLAHAESPEAKEGAYIGLEGPNIEI